MFPSVGSLDRAEDAALIDAITGATRAESQAAAVRLAAVAELIDRRCDDQDGRELWACDGWAEVGAEVGAALTINARAASAQMRIAIALRDRVPAVGALLAAGTITASIAGTITWHTHNVTDPEVLAMLDACLAGAVTEWGPLSREAMIVEIKKWVHKFDPHAVRETRDAARGRGINFGKPNDEAGTASVWGALLYSDAQLFERALTELAATVCADDPRTKAQRYGDAVGVLSVRGERMTCLCGKPDCAAASVPDSRAAAVIIHVLADVRPEPRFDPELNAPIQRPPVADPAPVPAAARYQPVGYFMNRQILPPNMLADLLARGAKVAQVPTAEQAGGVERYRPSAAQVRFVRMRHLTCTFPGCDKPATHCDIDHSTPWPQGPTHVANLAPKCRQHHLLKTFWTGPGGWSDRQDSDGTIVRTAPTGHQYRNVPGSRIMFPNIPFDTPPPSPTNGNAATTAPGRGLMMPTRRRTRAQDQAARIAYERQLSAQCEAEKAAEHARPITNDIPPPF
ncbi:MAG: DUF222 domain-containing protein [Mycobacterium sp.]